VNRMKWAYLSVAACMAGFAPFHASIHQHGCWVLFTCGVGVGVSVMAAIAMQWPGRSEKS